MGQKISNDPQLSTPAVASPHPLTSGVPKARRTPPQPASLNAKTKRWELASVLYRAWIRAWRTIAAIGIVEQLNRLDYIDEVVAGICVGLEDGVDALVISRAAKLPPGPDVGNMRVLAGHLGEAIGLEGHSVGPKGEGGGEHGGDGELHFGRVEVED